MKVFKKIELKGFGEKYQGKIRDCYTINNKLILITTDRISAFDTILGFIPFKGQVLNLLSAFWFENTKDIIKNHVIAVPDPNVTIAKNAVTIPLEIVVRGYITGVTDTSIWGSYQKEERIIYGVNFPDGLKKNDKLPRPVITPTTKEKTGHDERITKEDIIKRRIVSKDLYKQIETAALKLFERGTKICDKAEIILVDTKYEFGIYNNELILIDEIHTPDSSRFWIKKTYKERVKKGLEPENFDKEFLRLWYKKMGYTGDGKPPKMSTEFIYQVSKRYIKAYELLTGKKFIYPKDSINKRIKTNIKNYFKPKIAVLISNAGTGTNLQAIIDGINKNKINAKIAVVISDAKDAYGLVRSKKNKIPTVISSKKEYLLKILNDYSIEYVVLAGWKQFLTQEVMNFYKNKILNLHPGLIPDSINGTVKNPDGTRSLWNRKMFTNKALQNFLDNKSTYAGSSIHLLTNEIDFGPVLGRTFEKIKKLDTVETLYKRLKKKENSLYVNVLKKLTKNKYL